MAKCSRRRSTPATTAPAPCACSPRPACRRDEQARAHTHLTLAAHLAVTAAALLVEAACGYPSSLYRAIGHPVTWIGALIGMLDRRWNHPPRRRARGVVALLLVLAAAIVPAGSIARLPFGAIPAALLAATLLAQRSLHAHVRAVAEAMEHGSLDEARRAVAHIVGRNPLALDAHGIARAAIESLAENFSDAVVAPALWCALAGLPGIAAYKAINTADSMIGHRTPRHAAFGWAAARLDDLVNLPAARLSALLVAAAGPRMAGAALRAAWRDAARHRSPNAGWPEAAMAGALGLRLNGPRVYGETMVQDAWMGSGRSDAAADDIRRALALYRRACCVQIVLVLTLALIARA